MSSPDAATVRWRRSSRTDNGNGNCVELAVLGAGTAIRDSKDPHGGTLLLPHPGFNALRAATKAGHLDTPGT